MGGPPKSILAISDLTLGGSTDRADVPIGNAQQSLLQQRDCSNPIPSSAESGANLIFAGGSHRRLRHRPRRELPAGTKQSAYRTACASSQGVGEQVT
jgi:hypothetical protein